MRQLYRPFDSGTGAPTTRVYRHEMPGGQISNLRQQAIALGLGDRYEMVEDLYAEANRILGNIVKVTPSSKVVGDLALYLCGANADVAEFERDPARFRPPRQRDRVPGGGAGSARRGVARAFPHQGPGREKGCRRADLDLPAEARAVLATPTSGPQKLRQLLNSLLFPGPHPGLRGGRPPVSATSRSCPRRRSFTAWRQARRSKSRWGPGFPLYLALDAVGEADERGFRSVFCRLNGQPRVVTVRDRSVKDTRPRGERAQPDNPAHVAAPFAGAVSLTVRAGDRVEAGQTVATIEAMKMEAPITTSLSGTVERLAVPSWRPSREATF